jgi:hypothetical protein
MISHKGLSGKLHNENKNDFKSKIKKNVISYQITYCHMLRAGKTMDDFSFWINRRWQNQFSINARCLTMWMEKSNGENRIFYRYQVPDLQDWTKIISRESSTDVLEDLNKIVNLDYVSIKINPVYG